GLTVLAVWTIGALATLRTQRPIYVEPLLVLAAAVVVSRFPSLLAPGRARRLMIAGLVVVAALGLYKPAKNALRTVDPADHCSCFPTSLPRVGIFPFCPPVSAPADGTVPAMPADGES